MADIPIGVLYPNWGIFLYLNLEPNCLSFKNVTTSRDVWDALRVIDIETVKVASSPISISTFMMWERGKIALGRW